MDKLDITHLVPNFILGDKNGWALAKAIEAAMQIFLDKIQEGIDAALDPDKMPEWRLDELARDENVFWYDYSAPLAAKREMIKNASEVYATLGTRAGTQRAARDHVSDARIEEWYDYGGEPSHFRIFTNQGDAAESAAAMARSVMNVKRLTSVLDGIYIDLSPFTVAMHAGLALYSGSRVKYTMADVDVNSFGTWLTDESDTILLDESGMVLFE